MTNDRIELHSESHFSENLSFLSSYDIAREAKNYECTAVAVTDLNSVYTYSETETELSKRKVSMIYGITISCVDAEDRYDVVLLAKNIMGRDHIFRLVELMHKNYSMLGHAVTREQLEAYREGTLMGAAAHNGQLVRAVQHRRNQRYLDRIIRDYDYIEFLPEPYDISAEIFQLAQKHDIPLCAVQHAVLREKSEPSEYHAYCALNEYYLSDIKPAYWKLKSELEEEFKTLYILPSEREIAQRAIFYAPQKITEQIQQMPSVNSILMEGQEQWHRETMPKLKEKAEATLREKFGMSCPAAVRERVETELTLIDEYHAAPVLLYLSTLGSCQGEWEAGMVSGAAVNCELLHLWGVSEPDPMPRHIWCSECGCWEKAELELGAKTRCPCCGQTVTVSGLDLPVESLRDVLSDGSHFEFRCSQKVMEHLKLKFLDFKTAAILQEQLRVTDEADSEVLNTKIAREYLERHPELSSAMRRNRNFLYHITRHKPHGDEMGAPYCWYFCPDRNHKILPHVPAYSIEQNIHRLLVRVDHRVPMPRIMTMPQKGFELLAACETVSGIKPDRTAIYEPEIYQKILATASDPTAKDSAVAQVCRAFGMSLYHGREFFCDDEFSQNTLGDILKWMPLRSYEDLCRIMNITHGAGTWFGNAQELLEQGTVTPEQVIACREDIMEYLIHRGCKREIAFEIMEYVRKGKASSTFKSGEPRFLDHHWEALQKCGAEDWFIKSCQKIDYLFPRGHSAAMDVGLAKLVWYAIHTPEETERVFTDMLESNDD